MANAQGVYKITNTVTGQVYFGSSVNIRKRRNEHFARLRIGKHGNPKLQKSFNKYGESAFKFEVVELAKNFVEREQFYIDNHKPYFNICLRSNDLSSIVRTPEWNKNISIANTGRKISEETRERLMVSHLGKIPSNKGVPHSDETKRKVSESKKGTVPWNKGKKTGRNEKQIAAIAGRKHTDEELDKVRKPVNQIDCVTNKIIKTWPSGVSAGMALKINIGNIASCCTGNRKSAGGYIWETASR